MSDELAFSGLTSEELRSAVRAVLRDVLPPAVTAAPRTEVVAEEVSLRTDADLESFVRRVAGLCEDPARRAELSQGRHRFRLVPTPDEEAGDPGAVPVVPVVRVVRVDRGAVTERTVRKAAADGARLVVGHKAVLTPLARDRARALGIRVEREDP